MWKISSFHLDLILVGLYKEGTDESYAWKLAFISITAVIVELAKSACGIAPQHRSLLSSPFYVFPGYIWKKF